MVFLNLILVVVGSFLMVFRKQIAVAEEAEFLGGNLESLPFG
jgi:hypothetical protein